MNWYKINYDYDSKNYNYFLKATSQSDAETKFMTGDYVSVDISTVSNITVTLSA
jgi:hypothetical protein